MDKILLCIGVYNIIFSLINNTKNVKSAIVFKVIPFFSGLFILFYSLLNMGIIKL